MNKLDRLLLEQVISEELYTVLNEAGFFDKVKSGAKKLAAAGAMAGALASGGAQAAPDKPVKQQTTQVAKEENKIKDTHRAALGFLELFSQRSIKDKSKKLSFDENMELMKAQQALWGGKEIKGNRFYDGALRAIKKTVESKDSELFDLYWKAGNPKNFDFNSAGL